LPVDRLDAGRKQQAQEREDLLVVELLPVDVCVGEAADQVVAGLRATRRQDRREVLAQRLGRREGTLPVDGEGEDGDRPLLELRIVLLGQAEEVGDDLGGIRKRELARELRSAAVREPVDQRVGHGLDQIVLAPGNRPLGEGAGEQRAQAAVLGLVHAEHDLLAEHVAEDGEDDRGGERLVVSQHLRDLVVAVHHEDGLRVVGHGHARQVQALDGSFAPALGQLGVGIAHVAGDGVVEGPEVLEIVEQLHSSLLQSTG